MPTLKYYIFIINPDMNIFVPYKTYFLELPFICYSDKQANRSPPEKRAYFYVVLQDYAKIVFED